MGNLDLKNLTKDQLITAIELLEGKYPEVLNGINIPVSDEEKVATESIHTLLCHKDHEEYGDCKYYANKNEENKDWLRWVAKIRYLCMAFGYTPAELLNEFTKAKEALRNSFTQFICIEYNVGCDHAINNIVKEFEKI